MGCRKILCRLLIVSWSPCDIPRNISSLLPTFFTNSYSSFQAHFMYHVLQGLKKHSYRDIITPKNIYVKIVYTYSYMYINNTYMHVMR